ncbi:MAG: hypothetical protein R3290_07900 [Acidimicrobiia bacterium]|nr:hypothetical protein [Acidimicrobiia bacterium]
MAPVAVMNAPIADRSYWDQWMEDVTGSTETNQAHRDYLRRRGITSEHVFLQDTPAGTMMTLVWEGITQDDADRMLQEIISGEATDHERFMLEELMPKAHGIDPTEGPPPQVRHVTTLEP